MANSKSNRVLAGDVRDYYGRPWVVIRTERGRKGEARTMVVLGARNTNGEFGVVYPRETLSLATVQGLRLIGRGSLSPRKSRLSPWDDGGHYFSPKWGALP